MFLFLTPCRSVSCPTSMKPLDVQFMKAIHNKVNVVPVIAKADTLTLRERERLKRRVRTAVTHCSGSFPVPEINSIYHVLMVTALAIQCMIVLIYLYLKDYIDGL